MRPGTDERARRASWTSEVADAPSATRLVEGAPISARPVVESVAMPTSTRFRLPDGLFDGGNIAVWIGTGNAFFTQVRCARYAVAQVRASIGPVFELVRRRRPSGRLIWVSDSRRVVDYESGARALMTRWALAHTHELERILVVINGESRMVQMGVHVASAALAVVGASVEVATSFDALAKYGLQWPATTTIPDVRGGVGSTPPPAGPGPVTGSRAEDDPAR
jgi:hypothetical protein